MRIPSSLWRLVAASVGLFLLATAVSAQTQLHLGDETRTMADAPRNRLPVLFVHGHNDEREEPEIDHANYLKNWQEPLRGISFKQALEANAELGIEAYYIQFIEQNHSITNDARAIGEAIEQILHRHDPLYPGRATNVQVVIIAFSKGTISTRQYLKSLQVQVEDLPQPRPDFRPVSEFIAIAPPNHAISSRVFAASTSLAVKQLYNGFRPQVSRTLAFALQIPRSSCTDSFGTTEATNYITNLNTPTEAPGSRQDGTPPTAGTLYVTLVADGNRDFVGGLTPSTDCGTPDGRRLARNLSSDINLEFAIADDGWADINSVLGFPNDDERKALAVHQNTVHDPFVICKALYAAAHHRSPAAENCSLAPNALNPPVVPLPKRAAAMLTLDFSGSMSTRACELSNPGCRATRASVLKEAVELFVRLWQAVSVPSDRLGATYFRTNVTQFRLPNSAEPLPEVSAGGDAIILDVRDNQHPGGLTAMGGGLRVAINTLSDPSVDAAKRRVILFTDGMQNVSPRVEWNGTDQLVIAPESGPPPVASTVLDRSIGTPPANRAIVIDTIGIGAAGDFVTRLAEIADETGGQTRTTLDMGVLRQFFVEELINALKGFSPQLVGYRRGAVNSTGGTEAFAIENGVRKLVLKVSWQRGSSLDFTVARDGIDVTSAGRFIGGDFYKIFVIDLPASGQIAARGNWEVRINGNAGTSYEAAAIVDGSPISYDSNFDLKRPRAGEPLDLVVRLTAGGLPVAGTKVSVTLLSPTITAGDIIARSPPKDLPAFEPGMSIGERQLLALAQDPKRSAGLKPKPTKIELQPTGKGDFRARLSTDVPGIYTAFVTIEGSSPQLGQFSRTLTMTSVVRFANADRKASDIFASECDAGSGRRYVRIFLSPRDTKGHFMGPGSPSEIGVELSNGRVVGSTRDLGDGSYAILLEVPAGVDPNITLKVAGAAIFTDRLSQLSGKPRR